MDTMFVILLHQGVGRLYCRECGRAKLQNDVGKELEGGDQECGWCTATGPMWSESPLIAQGESKLDGQNCGIQLHVHTRGLMQLFSRVLSYHGKGYHPCLLCDASPLKNLLMGHLLSNQCRKLGLVNKRQTAWKLLLCRLVDLEIQTFNEHLPLGQVICTMGVSLYLLEYNYFPLTLNLFCLHSSSIFWAMRPWLTTWIALIPMPTLRTLDCIGK